MEAFPACGMPGASKRVATSTATVFRARPGEKSLYRTLVITASEALGPDDSQ